MFNIIPDTFEGDRTLVVVLTSTKNLSQIYLLKLQ